jgi:enoyl-CoA hydratase/3-hydroxyacyl-CoA dehydrogenase
MSTAAENVTSSDAGEAPGHGLVERFGLKAFVESCLVLEEGIATIRDIDLAMMTGFGIVPGPFARADAQGLDETLAALERAEREWGEHFAPPLILRRLVAQGRLGQTTGQGFFPYARPEEDFEQGDAVQLEYRDGVAIAWLNRMPTNAISPAVIRELTRIWEHVEAADGVYALVIASANPMLFCAGADIKAFTEMDEAGGRKLLDEGHTLLRSFGTSRVATVAAVNGLALGGGCELAMACDVRIAAESAAFGQPEINLGIIPGFGGTQRLPRLVGPAEALEMNLVGDAISADKASELGLANRVVPDHELFDQALQWARKLAGQPPLAVEQIKRVSNQADIEDGIEAEKRAFAGVFASEDAREGIEAFLQKRNPAWQGK